MRSFQRIFLFVLTNIAIIIALNILVWITFSIFDIQPQQIGFDYVTLAVFAIIFGFVGSFISLQMSKRLAKRSYRMQVIDTSMLSDEKFAAVYSVVHEIAQRENIATPEIYYYKSSQPNAFATGPSRDKGLIAVSTGLLDKMTVEEVRGVVGHEMAHIVNGDMVTMTLLQGVINTFVIFFARLLAFAIDLGLSRGSERGGLGTAGYFLVVIILDTLLGFAGMIVLMGYSRKREYAADAGSAQFLGRGPMIAALQKLQVITQDMKVKNDEFATLKIAGGKSRYNILSSHPSLEDRIQRLQEVAF